MSENKNNRTTTAKVRPDRNEAIDQITNFIVENDTWMLTTCGSDRVIKTRPMLNVNETFDGDLYLFANQDDELLESIEANPQANLVIAEPGNGRYVSLIGKAKQADDAGKLELLWSDRCKIWFEMDSPDESIALVKFDVASAEYWDSSGNVIGRINNFFTHSCEPSIDNVEHSVVEWTRGKSSVAAS